MTPHDLECLILAAGAGNRLRPLTARVPKPLLPLGDSTIIGRLVSQVSDLPLRRVLCNLHHAADVAEKYFAGTSLALPVTARTEDQLRGPAGSMHTFHDELAAAPFSLVLSGDLYLLGDLVSFVRRHVETGALLTVLAVEVDDGSRFGVFDLDAAGRPVGLVEKPAWARQRRSWVSGGVYCVDRSLLDRIPTDREYDFGAHLIPELLAEGAPVTIVPWLGRWNDLGTAEAYRATVLDDLGPAGGPPINLVAGSARVHPTAMLTGRVLAAPGATIGARAQVCDAVLLPDAVVPDDAIVVGGCVA
nr:nucleotidyltransferase family protein [Micromonospora sp. NBC_00855]